MSSEIEFWFDFGSAYAYFASLEIEEVAARHDRSVCWRPFMLGTAFKLTGAKGLSSTPLKKDYSRLDWERIARLRRVPFNLPPHHPPVALAATRAVYAVEREDPAAVARLVHALFTAGYVDRLDTSRVEDVLRVAERLGHDRAALSAAIETPEIKALAKSMSEHAIGRGVFGSPWMFVDGQPFWGWDRLAMLDDWLSRSGW
ncbi:MAG TPA: 2-hydroxychromene-2-carboxylate isomerase [Myxococcota bacterium]|nr:2-hydroxychromene-2-carboxylate isomerase [Myxococcota bacterium]